MSSNFSLASALSPTLGPQVGDFRKVGYKVRLLRPRPVDSRKNLVLFRETKLFQFGENQGAVYADFKRTTTALNEPGFNAVLVLNRVLQTCSIWEVESLSTIFNRDIHTRSLLARKREKCPPPRGYTPF